MMRRLFFVFVLTVIAISLQAQDKFVGKVIDGKSSMTLDAVSVTYKTKGGLTLAFGMTDERVERSLLMLPSSAMTALILRSDPLAMLLIQSQNH